MSDQTPEPTADEPAVEPEKTTNDLTLQDDVEVDDDQTPEPQPDFDDLVAGPDAADVDVFDVSLATDGLGEIQSVTPVDGGDQ